MEDHQDVVLQQRVWPWSIRDARRAHNKWVRWPQGEEKEKHRDKKHCRHCPTHHRVVQLLAVLNHDGHSETSQGKKPQQNGAL